MKIVVSMSGSLLNRNLTTENFRAYSDIVKRLWEQKHHVVVIVGGGVVCREYQRIAKDLGASDEELDFIGIMSTHLNASTFASTIGGQAYLVRWKSLEEAEKEVKKYFGKKIVVAGGYDVGVSSDYDAARFAKLVGADLVINATNVDGVYSEDPNINPNAKKYDKINYDDFLKILERNLQIPGEYRLFDVKGAQFLKKMGLKLIVVDGRTPEEIINAVEGGHHGTEIS